MKVRTVEGDSYSAESGAPSAAADLAWAETGVAMPAERFGWKAAGLCAFDAIAQMTPPGFAVSAGLVARLARGSVSSADLHQLTAFYDRLTDHERLLPIIVRASSSVDDPRTHSFAGLFLTVHGVSSFEGLVDAIRKAYRSADSGPVHLYSERRGASLPREHLGILVQLEMTNQYSASVQVGDDGDLIEAYRGQLSERIKGQGHPDFVVSLKNDQARTLYADGDLPQSFLVALEGLVAEVRRLDLRSHRKRAVLETVFDGRTLYVVQMNLEDEDQPIGSGRAELDLRGTVLDGQAQELGLKGAAMRYFRDRGLFGQALCIFPPAARLPAMEESLRATLEPTGSFTVRFSEQVKLGLPRNFFRRRESILPWVGAVREPNWTTIVHPYIDVRHSFEMLITDNALLLEHVPGMWESDNLLGPDVLMFDGSKVEARRYTESRVARFAGPDYWDTGKVPPTEVSDLERWWHRLERFVGVLREDFAAILPLNFHFVEDGEGKWDFLNIRPGFRPSFPAFDDREAHVVKEAADLETWDGASPILLRFTSARGAESRIISIASRLPSKQDFPLLVDFGLLSHPATILRELGFSLTPTYYYFGNRWLPAYERYEWPMDRGSDALRRIRKESATYADEHLRVVADREPIVEGHLLVVTEAPARSFADSEVGTALHALLCGRCLTAIPGGRWVFVERGRANFCTSEFTDKDAHGHLLPAHRFAPGIAADFAREVGASRCRSLSNALQRAREAPGEYVLIVGPDSDTYLATLPAGVRVEKQLIRRFFVASIK